MPQITSVAIILSRHYPEESKALSEKLSLPLVYKKTSDHHLYLEYLDHGLALSSEDKSLGHPLVVEFGAGASDHRRKFGGGKGQDIAKAVGLNKSRHIHVLDATAGLGRDAFVLATLGCQVKLFERNPIVHALLQDGLNRAGLIQDIIPIIEKMSLYPGDVKDMCQSIFDVVYLDPMFPERKKSAKVKKDMRLFHDLVGEDFCNEELLSWALDVAEFRVVVKRPKLAPFLEDKKPTLQFLGKSGRFDVYVKRSLEAKVG